MKLRSWFQKPKKNTECIGYVEGELLSWMEVDSSTYQVKERNRANITEALEKVSQKTDSIKLVLSGRGTYYGLASGRTPEELDLASLIPFQEGSYQVRTLPVKSLTQPGKKDYFFAAALSPEIEYLNGEAAKFGVTISLLEVPPTVMTRRLPKLQGEIGNKAVLQIYLGQAWTQFLFTKDSQPYVARETKLGMDNFLYHHRMFCQCDEQRSRLEMRSLDVTEPGPVEPVVVELLEQASRTVGVSQLELGAVVLSGAYIKGLSHRLAAHLGSPCTEAVVGKDSSTELMLGLVSA